MNYFEHFELPVSFTINAGALKRRFLQISKSVHPDFHSLASADQQEEALLRSTYNNEAYRVLSDDFKRLQYVLTLFGHLDDEGQGILDSDFLMEMIELNEQVMEWQLDGSVSAHQHVIRTVSQLEESLAQEVKSLLDKAPESCTAVEWQLIKAYYFKRRYLWRILENLDKASF